MHQKADLQYFVFKFLFTYFYFWLFWVLVAVCGLSLTAASGGYSLVAVGELLSLLWNTGSRVCGVVMAHGLSDSLACVIFPDQGSNLCPLHRLADS